MKITLINFTIISKSPTSFIKFLQITITQKLIQLLSQYKVIKHTVLPDLTITSSIVYYKIHSLGRFLKYL